MTQINKNIIIFLSVAVFFILFYIFFIRKTPEVASLVSSSSVSPASATNIPDANSLIAKDFLNLLLNVKNIKLDDSIFADNAFNSLRDSSIVLTPDGNEGRPNPFAPLGSENIIGGVVLPINIPSTNKTTP
ncbi:hypothetical protein A2818_00785 [Candidatus Nomurabacteria bacterium RIFCSPHIGHO2_01_FULL_40_12]|uniref:Uncharacterized protein n=1 Tax=Candidatus Nomurabacteria bacterium RIFCSPHIGHO2_01_FULL_40_12 TaxID=1801737 RepID=A0A1F6V198_9BACT|nr:MAG: hypothetical protein A2818_00785 [Candidatus Nomurabacteria bacterium RIFCSPHIGHO2_01_FULL_40_12]